MYSMNDPSNGSATAVAALLLLESLISEMERSGQLSAGAVIDIHRTAGRLALQLTPEVPGGVGIAAAQILAAFAETHSAG